MSKHKGMIPDPDRLDSPAAEQIYDDSPGKPETPPAASNAEPSNPSATTSNLARVEAIRAKQATPSPASLWSALDDRERRYLQVLWKDGAAEIMARDLADSQHVLDYLRPTPKWAEGSAQGFLVSVHTISTIVTDGALLGVRTIDIGTRLRVGVDCTPEERDKWLAAGLVKTLPCVTVRALVNSSVGVSNPKLIRGQLLVIEGGGNERLLVQWLELGFVEHICDGAYKGDLSALRSCPLPVKRQRKSRMKVVPTGDGYVRQIAEEYEETAEFATGPHVFGSRGFHAELPPLVRCRYLCA